MGATAFSQIGVWPSSDLAGANIEFKDFKFEEVGEVAAYTPQSIDCSTRLATDYKWLDTTSNANHGAISGATSVGDNDHLGVLIVKGRSEHGDSDHNYSGCLYVGGNTTSYAGRIDYNMGGNTELTIDNTHNHASTKTSFGMKTAGTRLPVLELTGDGAVKATSGTSANLKQVARVSSHQITVGTTAAANGSTKTIWNILHNLGTANVVVSVREGSASVSLRTQVETAVHAGEYYSTQNTVWYANTDYAAIEFASAPADNTVFDVTVIG